MKAGPRQSQFEPAEGKTVKFTDVHGVDEAKDVRGIAFTYFMICKLGIPGATRCGRVPQGSVSIRVFGW